MNAQTILLIEDNDDHACAIDIMIAGRNGSSFALERARSLESAIDFLRDRQPALILLDLHLPDAHGLSLLNHVRTVAAQVPIVVLTALDDEGLAIEAVTCGAQDYLVKGSFDTKTLTRAIRHALARHEVLADLEHARSREAQRATHDHLTGLPNRMLFFDRLGHAVARSERSGSHFAVVFIDLDGFKTVNDMCGHDVGDDLLRQVAARLTANVRANDTVARLGGDEFTILYEGVSDRPTADALVRHLQATFAEPCMIDGRPHSIVLSAGLALYPENGRDVDALLKFADSAMYAHKRGAKSHPTNGTDSADRSPSPRTARLTPRTSRSMPNK